jgi:hypothetical protein
VLVRSKQMSVNRPCEAAVARPRNNQSKRQTLKSKKWCFGGNSSKAYFQRPIFANVFELVSIGGSEICVLQCWHILLDS